MAFITDTERIYNYICSTFVNSSLLDDYGRTPLHYAICAPHELQLFLEQNMYDINHQDCLGHTALYKALQMITRTPIELANMRDAVRMLLFHGADPNIQHPSDPSPLMLAVLKEDSLLIDLLLSANANVSYRQSTDGLSLRKGDTAVSIAVQNITLSIEQYTNLGKLIIHKTTTPATVFHALQKTNNIFLRKYILKMNSLNPTPPV